MQFNAGGAGGGMNTGAMQMSNNIFANKQFVDNMTKKDIAGKETMNNDADQPKQSIFDRIAKENPGGFEDARLCKLRVGQIRMLDKVSVIIGTFSQMLSTQTYNLEFNLRMGWKLNVLLSLVAANCFTNLFVTYFKKEYQIKYMVARKAVPDGIQQYHIWSIPSLAFEYLMIQLAPNPFLAGYKVYLYFPPQERDIYYHYNDFLTIIMTCKFIYLMKGLLNMTVYDSDRGARVARLFGAQPGQVLVFKCIMRDNPFLAVILLFIGGVTFFGYVIMIAEAPISRLETYMNYTSYINACWGTVATMTTVGYGDMYPRTNLGRLVMIVCSMYGVIVVSLMVVTVTNFLCMSQMESASYTIMKKLEYKEMIKKAALQILVNVNRNTKGDPEQEQQRYIRIKGGIDNFRFLRRVYRNIGELSLLDEMGNHFNKVLGEMSDLKDMIELGTWSDSIKDLIKTEIGKIETLIPAKANPIPLSQVKSNRNVKNIVNSSKRSIFDPNKNAYLKKMERQVRSSYKPESQFSIIRTTDSQNDDQRNFLFPESPAIHNTLIKEEERPKKTKFIDYNNLRNSNSLANQLQYNVLNGQRSFRKISTTGFVDEKNQNSKDSDMSSENTLHAVNGSDSDKEDIENNEKQHQLLEEMNNENRYFHKKYISSNENNLESPLKQEKGHKKPKKAIIKNHSIKSLKDNHDTKEYKDFEKPNTEQDYQSHQIIKENYTYIFNANANYNNSNVNYNRDTPLHQKNQINQADNNNNPVTIRDELRISDKYKKKEPNSFIVKHNKFSNHKVLHEVTLDSKNKRSANKDIGSPSHADLLQIENAVNNTRLNSNQPVGGNTDEKNYTKEEQISSRRPLNYEMNIDKNDIDDEKINKKHKKYEHDYSFDSELKNYGDFQFRDFSALENEDSASNKNAAFPRNKRINPNSNAYKNMYNNKITGNKNQTKEVKKQISIYDKKKTDQKQGKDNELRTLQNFGANSREIVPQIIQPKNIDTSNFLKQTNVETLSDKLCKRDKLTPRDHKRKDSNFKIMVENMYREDAHDLNLHSRLPSEVYQSSQKSEANDIPKKNKDRKLQIHKNIKEYPDNNLNNDNHLVPKLNLKGSIRNRQSSNQRNISRNDGIITRDSKKPNSIKSDKNSVNDDDKNFKKKSKNYKVSRSSDVVSFERDSDRPYYDNKVINVKGKSPKKNHNSNNKIRPKDLDPNRKGSKNRIMPNDSNFIDDSMDRKGKRNELRISNDIGTDKILKSEEIKSPKKSFEIDQSSRTRDKKEKHIRSKSISNDGERMDVTNLHNNNSQSNTENRTGYIKLKNQTTDEY